MFLFFDFRRTKHIIQYIYLSVYTTYSENSVAQGFMDLIRFENCRYVTVETQTCTSAVLICRSRNLIYPLLDDYFEIKTESKKALAMVAVVI